MAFPFLKQEASQINPTTTKNNLASKLHAWGNSFVAKYKNRVTNVP